MIRPTKKLVLLFTIRLAITLLLTRGDAALASKPTKPNRPNPPSARGAAVSTAPTIVVSRSTAVVAVTNPANHAPVTSTARTLAKPLNIPAAELFDHYVSDPAVRALAKSRFNAHHALTRNDMIAIFRQAEKAGPVSAPQLKSLQNIVADAGQLHLADYVRDLSTKVLFGDAANAHYLGKPLGNLRAGNSPSNLEALVQKWFLGTDPPAVNSDYHYELAKGILYNGVPRLADVHQGDTADCFFLSSLGESALLDWKKAAGMFIDNRDGTYTVRYYRAGRPTYVTVDRYLPVDGDHNLAYDGTGDAIGDAKTVLWVALAEKAFVQLNESGWVKTCGPAGVNDYAALDKGGYGDAAIGYVTGLPTTSADLNSVASTNLRELTLATSNDKSGGGIAEWHTYAVTGYNAQQHTVTLFNPWGVKGDDPNVKYGSFTLNWDDFVANFKEVDHSTRPES